MRIFSPVSVILLAVSLLLACARPGKTQRVEQAVERQTPDNATKAAAIKSIDFSNFAYPWIEGLGDPKKPFQLRDGKYDGGNGTVPMAMFSVVYADVTNDGEEDAIVALDVIVRGGSAAPNVIYIYSVQDKSPKLLWAFGTGDRAQGGLRQVVGENGMLVVELYGKGKVIGTDLFADDGTGAMTPEPFYYTRTRYKWTGSKFSRVGPIETLSDPKNFRIPIMSPLSHRS